VEVNRVQLLPCNLQTRPWACWNVSPAFKKSRDQCCALENLLVGYSGSVGKSAGIPYLQRGHLAIYSDNRECDVSAVGDFVFG
jgi:hypothetical protein